jgi:mono/diheme cytochrome c family protein
VAKSTLCRQQVSQRCDLAVEAVLRQPVLHRLPVQLLKDCIVKARISVISASSLVLSLLLASCGGGGGSGDVTPGETPTSTVTGPNSFLLFPNPQVQANGTVQTNTVEYATAYYAAIDPNNDKDTLPKWKAANGFGTAPGALGEVTATFGDQKDLGYGRRMTARQNADGTIAVFVENYSVNAGEGYTYTPLNLDAAVVQDAQWHVGTNAIEFSPGPGGTWRFAKFYTYDPTPPYARRLMANLDGRGLKAMPGICISCHGGRGDPLTPPTGTPAAPLFPLVMNSESQARGDVQARMQMLNADSFGFSSTPGYTRADLEPAIKTINKMVLCSYPIAAMTANPEDACRQDISTAPNQYAQYEWQGTAATALKAAYGGDGLPNATFSDTYVPSGWLSVGQSSLYTNVLHPACITCHTLRGTGNQSDLDFDTYAKFQNYSDRIKAHVFDRGNMPLAKIVSEKFWSTSSEYSTLATWLQGLGYTTFSGSTVLQPGRPIADPGPDRTVRFGPTTLSAANSLYATGYSWSITTNPGNAGSLTNPTSATPQFTATANGTYVLQLVVSNGAVTSDPASLTLVVNNALTPDPASIRFSDIKTVLQSAGATCTNCHSSTPASGQPRPPIFYNDYDRDGIGGIDATDDLWFYTELRGRINFTDIAASPLLRKPAGHHHRGTPLGTPLTRFDASLPPGSAGRANYDLFLNWILNGAPQ